MKNFVTRLVCFTAVLTLSGGYLSAKAQQSPAGNPLNDLLAIQMNWDASKSDDNARPVVTMKFVPYEHHKQDGKSFTSYYVYAPGLARDTSYTLIMWQIGWDANQPPFQPTQSGLFVNARGVVMCRKPTAAEMNSEADKIDSDARLDLISAGSMGEPVRYALSTDSNDLVAMGRLIVNPIEADDHGCHLQAILAVGGGEIMLVEGIGFAANTQVELSRADGDKPQTAKFKADQSGRIETVAILIRKGATHGTAKLTMKSESCAPAVQVNWGRETYKVQ